MLYPAVEIIFGADSTIISSDAHRCIDGTVLLVTARPELNSTHSLSLQTDLGLYPFDSKSAGAHPREFSILWICVQTPRSCWSHHLFVRDLVLFVALFIDLSNDNPLRASTDSNPQSTSKSLQGREKALCQGQDIWLAKTRRFRIRNYDACMRVERKRSFCKAGLGI